MTSPQTFEGTADGSTAYQGASAEAIQSHYDIGNEFYELWLDPTRTYSCALWDGPDDTLTDAQARKHDYLVEQTRADRAKRVLDVGSGWGALLRRLVERHGVAEAVGLTLSQAQLDHVQGWADDRYELRLENWIDHRPTAGYDAIISIGAFEHFADMGMDRAERIAAYREFFLRCREWLPPGGRLAVQTMIKGNNTRMSKQTVRDLLFMIDRIFPESELPWSSELVEASERAFDIVSVRNDADHYARTCLEWRRRLLADRDRAEAMVGGQAVDDYDRYLSAAASGFQNRHLGLARVIFERA